MGRPCLSPDLTATIIDKYNNQLALLFLYSPILAVMTINKYNNQLSSLMADTLYNEDALHGLMYFGECRFKTRADEAAAMYAARLAFHPFYLGGER